MNIYIMIKNGSVEPIAFTSLKSCCIEYDLNYNTAAKGKRIFIKQIIHIFHIHCLPVRKIKGRENNGNFKKIILTDTGSFYNKSFE